jgi:hypothetical protein
MSSQDLGTQEITIKYANKWTAEAFGKRLNKIIKEGIYDGGLLSYSSPEITLSPFVAEFRTTGGQNVRVVTSENIVFNKNNPVTPTNPVVPTESKPYITATYSWLNSVGNFLDFSAKSAGELTNNTIIFGKALFSGSEIIGFNYDDRSLGQKDTDENFFVNSIVLENKNDVSSGLISSGLVITGEVISGEIVGYYNEQKIGIPFNYS